MSCASIMHRERGLARLAPVGPLVREEQRPRQLLRQRAARPRASPDARSCARRRGRGQSGRRRDACRSGDPRRRRTPAAGGRDVGERHVLTVLVHAEPAPAVCRQEPGVADAARQPMDGIALAQRQVIAIAVRTTSATKTTAKTRSRTRARPERSRHQTLRRRRLQDQGQHDVVDGKEQRDDEQESRDLGHQSE